MSDVSAVILSARPVGRSIPGVVVLPHVSRFEGAEGLLRARLAAIERVRTPWFFFLDDDDELPADYERVLARCLAVPTPLAYTDEIVTAADGSSFRRRSAPYSEQGFIRDPMLVHHMAVCRTDAARRASRVIPRGRYAVENLLFFEVARAGATYVPEVGYVWHRRATGLSRHPSLLIGQVRSSGWTHRRRGAVS